VNVITKVRVSLLGLVFGAALVFAPSAHAQAESNPDHFTETGVEVGPGGNVMPAAHASTANRAKNVKPVAHAAAQTNSSATPVHVAMAVADKNRSAVPTEPKR
jgi:hypothetical protein